MTRTKQSGSGLSFIVIGVILAVLLAGGVYLVRQQLAEPDQTWLPEENSEIVVTDEEEEEVVNEPTPVQEEVPVTGVETAELPQTGVGEVSSVISLGLLSLAAVAYVRSRRPELSL